MKIVGMATGYD